MTTKQLEAKRVRQAMAHLWLEKAKAQTFTQEVQEELHGLMQDIESVDVPLPLAAIQGYQMKTLYAMALLWVEVLTAQEFTAQEQGRLQERMVALEETRQYAQEVTATDCSLMGWL